MGVGAIEYTTMAREVLTQHLHQNLKPAEVIAMEAMAAMVMAVMVMVMAISVMVEVPTQHLNQNLKPAELIAMEAMVMEDMAPEADMVTAMAIMDKKYLNH